MTIQPQLKPNIDEIYNQLDKIRINDRT